ncbi:kinase-like domain-containing protein [Powellomyces hirtus]|nr:kinase-like domain-containing protein [Powellomyces hirtus]
MPSKHNTFQIGDCLGKGAFGCVYAALNMTTGEVVAVKQIRTKNIIASDMTLIMAEIDLLKELHHPNIVKYLGFSKTPSSLNIIMEYCENGSLSSISRKFGKFTEKLVAFYTAQVLDGLVYLHEQGVIHRDIKGPNILTTKDGHVKLADFGIASKVNATSTAVAGSPYWMAPEVIELSGATTASDVWSLGCTIIELLEGHPPYHDLAPMSALFRIVHDEYPPIPDRASPVLRHFLMECFQKDPNLRISAGRLLLHPLIVAAREVSKPIRETQSHDPSEPSGKEASSRRNYSQIGQGHTAEKCAKAKTSPSTVSTRDTSRSVRAASSSLSLVAAAAEADSDNEVWDDDFVEGFNEGFNDTVVTRASQRGEAKQKQQQQDPLLDQRQGELSESSAKGPTIDASFIEDIVSEHNYTNEFELPEERPSLLASDVVRTTNFEDELPLSQVEDDEQDPFANLMLDDSAFAGIGGNDNDNAGHHSSVLESFVAQVKAFRQHKKPPSTLSLACDTVMDVVKTYPSASKLIMTHHGIVPVIRLLQTLEDAELARKLLVLLNQCILSSPEIREAICLLGGLSSVLRFAHIRFPLIVRAEVAVFVQDMCCSATDLNMPKMFLFCGGLPALVYMLSGDYWENRKVVWAASEALASIFAVQTSASRTDLCLLFAHHGLLPHLANIFRSANSDRNEPIASSTCVAKILNVFLAISLADSSVRELLAQGNCLRVLVAELRNVDPERLVVLLKCLKNVSMCGEALSALDKAGAIPLVCNLLARHGMPLFTDVQNQSLNILYNLCRLNRARQQSAAINGCIPHLQCFVQSNSPLRQFALPILCDLVNGIAATNVTVDPVWTLLKRWRVIESYVALLKDPAWIVLAVEAIASWVSTSSACSASPPLPQPIHSQSLATAFNSAPISTLANLLLPLQRILVSSPLTRFEFSNSAPVHDKITRALLSASSAGVRLNLLLMLFVIGVNGEAGHAGDKRLRDARRRLHEVVGKLCQEDPAVLVREQARKCFDAFGARG